MVRPSQPLRAPMGCTTERKRKVSRSVFNFLFNRAGPESLTIRQALVRAGLSAAEDPARITVLAKHGDYSGRRVSFFQAFEPGQPDLLLGSGHVERDGVVVVNH